jgi:hypothetical protein
MPNCWGIQEEDKKHVTDTVVLAGLILPGPESKGQRKAGRIIARGHKKRNGDQLRPPATTASLIHLAIGQCKGCLQDRAQPTGATGQIGT